MNQKVKSLLGLWIAIGAISTAAIFIRFAQSGLSSLTIATFRMLLSSIVLLPIFFSKHLGEVNSVIRLRTGLLIILSGFFLSLHFYSWVSSLEFTNVTSSVVLVTTTPIWVTIISVFWLKEKIRRGFWIGLLVAMVGTIVITRSSAGFSLFAADDDLSIKGNLLALIGAWCAAGYVLIGKRVRESLSTIAYIFLVYACSALILLIIAAVSGQPLLVFTPKDWLWLVLLALIPQLIGHSLINWALGVLPAAKVSIALLGEPVGASLLALVFLKEIPSGNEVIGGGLILAGIYLALISDAGAAKKAEISLN